jgi:rhodanese-related sulfurtransferase
MLISLRVEGKGLTDGVKIEDVPADETWAHLKDDAKAVLIDVRTRPEWTFVGLPDLSTLNKRVVTIEWQTFPDNRVDPDFVEKLSRLLEGAGVSKNDELFFVCRSGARSRSAAVAMADAGYTRCRNVEDGFEGPLDPTQKRGQVAGWKAAGLPWRQG